MIAGMENFCSVSNTVYSSIGFAVKKYFGGTVILVLSKKSFHSLLQNQMLVAKQTFWFSMSYCNILCSLQIPLEGLLTNLKSLELQANDFSVF